MKISQRYLNISCESIHCVPPSHMYRRICVLIRVYRCLYAFTVWTAVMCVSLCVFTVLPPSCVYRRLCVCLHVCTAVCVCVYTCVPPSVCVFTRVYRRLYAFTMWTAVFLCFSSHTLIRKYEMLSCYPTSPLKLSFLICRCPVAYSSSKVSTELVKASLFVKLLLDKKR